MTKETQSLPCGTRSPNQEVQCVVSEMAGDMGDITGEVREGCLEEVGLLVVNKGNN